MPARAPGDGEALDRAGLDLRMRRRQHAGTQLNGAREQRLERIAAAGEGDGCHLLQAFAQLEHLGLELGRGSDRRRRGVELVGIGLGEGDELLHRGGAEIRHHREHVRRHRELADGDEILERIVGRRVVEAGIDRVGAGRQQDRIAVGVRARDVAHADIAAAAALVLHDDRGAHRLLHRGRHEARDDVGWSARGVGDHDPDRTIGIGGECRADAQNGRRGEARERGLDQAAPRRRSPDVA